MIVEKEIDPCREAVRAAQRKLATGGIGLVPTMGAFHEGHLSLIRAARNQCRFVAVTIFVNPTQFGPGEDYEAYPHALDADLATCEQEGVDLVFTPGAETMYPDCGLGIADWGLTIDDPQSSIRNPQSRTTVHVSGVTEGLCGPHRPGHFDGVATVVTKLFNILPANLAFFGEKDYQQLVMIRRMVRDLNIPIEIVACPTVREPDGLAMSSRNAYLSASERKQATSLSRALFAAAEAIRAGQRNAAGISADIRKEILAAGPADIEYVNVVDANTLEVLSCVDRPARICLAVRIGSCRLIDNIGVTIADCGLRIDD